MSRHSTLLKMLRKLLKSLYQIFLHYSCIVEDFKKNDVLQLATVMMCKLENLHV